MSYSKQLNFSSVSHPFQFVLFCLSSVVMFSGCQPKQQLPPDVEALLVSPESGLSDAGDGEGDTQPKLPDVEKALVSEEDWIDSSLLPWTYAEVHYLRGSRIGYSSMTVARSDISEFNQLYIRRIDVLDQAPDGTSIAPREVTYEAYERPNGELASFRFLAQVDGQSELEVEGRMIFDNLEISRRVEGGSLQRQKVVWPVGTWGPLGVQSVLMRSPMEPGQIRELQFYLPQMAQYVQARLEAIEYEITPLAGRAVSELLKIEALIGTSESGVRSHLWVDRAGVIHKTMTLSGDPILRVRVDQETVQRLSDQSRFERMVQSEIELSGKLEDLTGPVPLTVEVQAIEFDPFSKFLKYSRQQVLSKGAGTCQISTGINDDSESSSEEPDAEVHLSSSALVPADSRLITELVRKLLGEDDQLTAEDAAVKLQTGLHQMWTLEPPGKEIKSTLSAARKSSGSSFECAAVLASLLRNREIPARMVGGLYIDPSTHKARFHVWTQAWINQRWTDLDAGQAAPVTVYHLAMAISDGSGENPYKVWLPFLEIIKDILDLRVM